MPDPVNIEFVSMNVRVEGDVQGCGFRDYTVAQATARGLQGWVRNRSDGSVETVAFGPKEEVERFITTLIKGPPGAKVTAIDISAAKTPDEPGFTRRASL